MANPDLVNLGRLLGNQTRVDLLDALFDGRAYTVTELKNHVGVAASTASEHLSQLLDGGLVETESQGRHHYYRLSGPEAAALLESFSRFSSGVRVKTASKVPADLMFSRTCYNHLAGTVAVGLTERLVELGLVDLSNGSASLTAQGLEHFSDMGVTPRGGTAPVKRCLDWSERRVHLSGSMPIGLLDFMIEQRWFVRKPMSRALQLTSSGRLGLYSAFGYQAP